MAEAIRPFSTKLARPVPEEFEALFREGGWAKVNAAFGKRASQRYFTAIGAAKLSAIREAELFGRRTAAADVRQKRLGRTDPFVAHYQRFGIINAGEPA